MKQEPKYKSTGCPGGVTVGAPSDRESFPCLDGVRGMAVLMVLLDHANDSGLKLAGIDMNRAGKYGVFLFFVLSAFLLTHQLCLKSDKDLKSRGTWFHYAFRRFTRIFPMYALVLVIFYPGRAISHLLLREGMGPFWAIPVEVKYYVLLPFVGLAMIWVMRGRWLEVAASAVGAIAVGALLFFGERAWSSGDAVWLARNIAPFLMGSAIAVVYGVLERDAQLRRRLAWWLECAAIIALVASFLRIPSLYNWVFKPADPISKYGSDPLVCGVLWSVFLLGCLAGKNWLGRAMSWMPLRYMGWISFSLYLWHKKIIDEVRDWPMASALRLLLYLIIVIAVSTVSYFILEKPISRLRFKSRKDRSSSGAGPMSRQST